jgi:hypothetical protein
MPRADSTPTKRIWALECRSTRCGCVVITCERSALRYSCPRCRTERTVTEASSLEALRTTFFALARAHPESRESRFDAGLRRFQKRVSEATARVGARSGGAKQSRRREGKQRVGRSGPSTASASARRKTNKERIPCEYCRCRRPGAGTSKRPSMARCKVRNGDRVLRVCESCARLLKRRVVRGGGAARATGPVRLGDILRDLWRRKLPDQ